MQEDFENYLSYLRFNYFTESNFKSFKNYSYAMLYENNMDTTNNSAEAVNSKFNSTILPCFKSYLDICRYITDYKKSFYENKTTELGLRAFKKRDPKLTRLYDIRRDYVSEFDDLFLDEKESHLIGYMCLLQEIPAEGAVSPLRVALYQNINFAV